MWNPLTVSQVIHLFQSMRDPAPVILALTLWHSVLLAKDNFGSVHFGSSYGYFGGLGALLF